MEGIPGYWMAMLQPPGRKVNGAKPTTLSLITNNMYIEVKCRLLATIDEGTRHRTNYG